jgi:hypothetical protein
VKVSIECPDVSITALRDRGRHIARQLPPRTATRRAVVAMVVALTSSSSLDSARRALRTFGSEQTQTAAAAILDKLAEPQNCAIAFNPDRGNYACSTCGATARPVPEATTTPGER